MSRWVLKGFLLVLGQRMDLYGCWFQYYQGFCSSTLDERCGGILRYRAFARGYSRLAWKTSPQIHLRETDLKWISFAHLDNSGLGYALSIPQTEQR
ncbi:hypothetical protein AVEN_119675-1 [Araneus ventricosus]|uniref:Uncharacterized protein n=1 Tax=Araneus ventricosus TaxID=182803 RepID=A0A4Y2KII0_ARAVE|nr:hypothetical protein AVEN_119675-1 [Araneus ventricosus]